MIYAHIVGWGKYVPPKVMTNHDLSKIVDTTDEWIVPRTGIRERRIAGPKESAFTMGYAAAREALEKADILPSEVGLIICATATPEHTFPSTASLIQDALGATHAGANSTGRRGRARASSAPATTLWRRRARLRALRPRRQPRRWPAPTDSTAPCRSG